MLEARPIPATDPEEAIASVPALPVKAVEKCPNCGVEYEPGFEACWSCGQPFDATFLEAVESDEPAAPSAKPENVPMKSEASRLEIIQEADDLAKKAWIAAVFGFPFCLLCLRQIYSTWLVLLLLVNRFPLTRRGVRHLQGAILLDLIGFGTFGCFLWSFFR
jgi:hypothetical protein